MYACTKNKMFKLQSLQSESAFGGLRSIVRLRASSDAFGHRKTLRRSAGAVDVLVLLSAIESSLEAAIITP